MPIPKDNRGSGWGGAAETVSKVSEGRVIRAPDSGNTSENGGSRNSPLRREIVSTRTLKLGSTPAPGVAERALASSIRCVMIDHDAAAQFHASPVCRSGAAELEGERKRLWPVLRCSTELIAPLEPAHDRVCRRGRVRAIAGFSPLPPPNRRWWRAAPPFPPWSPLPGNGRIRHKRRPASP